MLKKIIELSINNKLFILLLTATIIGFGIFSLTQLPIGAVPDITNNQVQVITTSRNLSTQDVEQFITYPVELEMANLPGVKEIRSVSKFGLSVVTIVFEDEIGTYLPRQLIAEKIKSAADNIPEGFGTPEMGPITTGLGEIYQYILDTKEGYKDKYTPMQLRTIQDWVVKRQLSGIPGVVEVNTWGGFLKQYEIALQPDKLTSLNLTIAQVLDAIEKNNSVAGGGYIEKTNETFFIRGEGKITSLSDIESVVVENRDGIPILIKDIADVTFGYATRFGAITGNGEGEKVLGQIMMLKDGDSNKVIEAVKQRVDEIQKTLPEGVYINGFLERSELIGKTTFTITENLLLGVIIVIFVVILLLGSLRSGLVVASVIPLALLVTLSLMYVFGVDANLMSLGAIDFGIIIDGAVIIVEYVAYKITSNRTELVALSKSDQQKQIDKITFDSSSKMMNSAVFGQLIILIVFIPILSLSGVEGKMFKPMALAFSFALLGAMFLCFTYVPVISSMFLRPEKITKRNISKRLISFLVSLYEPTITWALHHKKIVIVSSIALLVATGILFSRMGGEFIPTLDEGDFVIQPVLKTGTSLTKTTEITTEIERILLENFPEVDQVVSRIGAAEVPTDPMSMEESDVIIKLRPKKEWVSADSKDELADKFKEKLSIIPGIDFEFTQPIEMRFNELITGVRADVAVKIFGEDLAILASKAEEIKSKIEDVEGASDIIVEKVDGLPQMSVTYNRSKIARYGLTIEKLNELLSMAFAGKTMGSVFEGERRFDMVIRLNESYRKSIDDIKNLYIDTPSGLKIPFHEVATISYTKGPAKISRDDTKRRIVIGINVRNRDMQSVVHDVQEIIENQVKLPSGYYISYGGQFENLNSAKARLKIAVPIALVLIFILLHFAFKSIKEALMVFSAIPLATVGGVVLLELRGLPFSISAGVGFIALFGIAVLNGIVLIEHLKELKAKGMDDINERILRGTKERLRPVILTAAAAALGFLPMAISTNAGAEVQRPLATVVIGGLVSATFLTMVVLPVLYSIFETNDFSVIKASKKSLMLLLFLLPSIGNSQEKGVTLEKLLQMAYENNTELAVKKLTTEKSIASVGNAFSIENTSVYYLHDNTNLGTNGKAFETFGISQNIDFPTVYFSRKKVLKKQQTLDEISYQIAKNDLTREISKLYYSILFLQTKRNYLKEIDSLYTTFSKNATRRFELGETTYLEMITAKSKKQEFAIQFNQVESEITIALNKLCLLTQQEAITIQDQVLELIPLVKDTNSLLIKNWFQEQQQLTSLATSLAKHEMLPGIEFNFFNSKDTEINTTVNSYQAGLSIPLFFANKRATVKTAKIAHEIANEKYTETQLKLTEKEKSLRATLEILQSNVTYYVEIGNLMATEIIKTAKRGYEEGEIDFFQYIQSIENASAIQISYFESMNNYNQIALEINYLTL